MDTLGIIATRELGERYLEGKGVEENPDKAFECFKSAANAGDAVSLRQLGLYFGDKIDEFECFQKASDLGDTIATRELGDCYRLRDNDVKALECFQKAADAGDANALYRLGWCYTFGKCGVAEDKQRALEYYQKSADMGYFACAVFLSKIYLKGSELVDKNLDKAAEYLSKASVYGAEKSITLEGTTYSDFEMQDGKRCFYDLAMAFYPRGVHYPQDLQKTREFLKKASEFRAPSKLEHLDFNIAMAVDYAKGSKDYDKDLDKAVFLITDLMPTDCKDTVIKLYQMVTDKNKEIESVKLEIRKVRHDITSAVASSSGTASSTGTISTDEVRKAPDEKDLLYRLGVSFYPHNLSNTHKYLSKATELGHIHATIRLATLCAKGEGVEKNPIKGMSFLKAPRFVRALLEEFVKKEEELTSTSEELQKLQNDMVAAIALSSLSI